MPFVLILAGVVLLVSAVRNTHQELFHLLAVDFTGPNNFVYWFVSILIIGAVGYIPKMKPVSDGFLILVILVLFIRRGGFFDQFSKVLAGTQAASPQVSATGGTRGEFAYVSLGSVGGTIGTGGVHIGVPTGGTVTLPGGVNVSIGV